LPYFYHGTFCGAQIRFIKPKENKVVTLPGTRNSYLFYNWDQSPLYKSKGLIICEGAFDAISLEQCFRHTSLSNFKCISTSGSNLSDYQAEILRHVKDQGGHIILCPDSDPAGFNMLDKALKKGCITHFSLTKEKADWNDQYRMLGSGLIDLFLTNLQKI
jgi:DNA primase